MIGYGFSGHSAPMCALSSLPALWSLCDLCVTLCHNSATILPHCATFTGPLSLHGQPLPQRTTWRSSAAVRLSNAVHSRVLLRTPIVASPNWAELQCGGRAWHVMDIMVYSCYTHVTHADFRFLEDDYGDLPRAIDAPWPYAMKDRTDIFARARVRGTVPWLWEILGMGSRIQALSHQLTSSNPSLYIPFISTFLPFVTKDPQCPWSCKYHQISLCHDVIWYPDDIHDSWYHLISMFYHVLICSIF